MSDILELIKDPTLTYQQRMRLLAKAAENTLEVLDLSETAKDYLAKGTICDLFEGNAPFVGRYILPDYERFMRRGSEFLELDPPKNLLEAINALLILYKHVPSITSFPVYLGNIDTLLDPFIEDKESARPLIRMFLTHLDRTLADSFVHANIGPKPTVAGELILEEESKLKNAVPNLTLKYGPETSDQFAMKAITTGLEASKPSFVNHPMLVKEFGEEYAIVSCYNSLPIRGGAYTLVRLNLKALADSSSSPDQFFSHVLPAAVDTMLEIMDKRIAFLVEESGFFNSHFLATEGLIERERFTAMFGVFGLAECVNTLVKATTQKDRFGHSEAADKLGVEIMQAIQEQVGKHTNPYCEISDNRFLLHAQSGIGGDEGITPGCRIPVGDEPYIYQHITQAGKFHHFFPAGISDIFSFEPTAKQNPQHVLDIIKGAMESGLRMFAFYSSDTDLIRITGYLVKRSEMEKLKNQNPVLQDTVALGLEVVEKSDILHRKVR